MLSPRQLALLPNETAAHRWTFASGRASFKSSFLATYLLNLLLMSGLR